jgi:hypothetical protein
VVGLAAIGSALLDLSGFTSVVLVQGRLSGLIADVLGDHVVVLSCSAWVERNAALIRAAIQGATGLRSIVWRPSLDILREEGVHLGSGAAATEEPTTRAEGAVQVDSILHKCLRHIFQRGLISCVCWTDHELSTLLCAGLVSHPSASLHKRTMASCCCWCMSDPLACRWWRTGFTSRRL